MVRNAYCSLRELYDNFLICSAMNEESVSRTQARWQPSSFMAPGRANQSFLLRSLVSLRPNRQSASCILCLQSKGALDSGLCHGIRQVEGRGRVYEDKKKHTTGGIPRWSPTLVLVARFSAYVWQSGRDAQFSLTCGRM